MLRSDSPAERHVVEHPVEHGRQARVRAEFDEALNRFCDEWNRGSDDRAVFQKEYLVVVGTRR